VVQTAELAGQAQGRTFQMCGTWIILVASGAICALIVFMHVKTLKTAENSVFHGSNITAQD